ncbi:MAG: hypothetical protein J6X55_13400 [Victivallales bacterium]|nr:hypothetical protein [Victivallales bacterium]
MMKKLVIFALIAFGVLIFAEEHVNNEQENVKYKQGCRVQLWLIGEDKAPLEVGIDRSDSFSENNLKDMPSFASHYNYARMIHWRGLINIPHDGTYCFSGSLEETDRYKWTDVWVGVKTGEQKFRRLFGLGINIKTTDGKLLTDSATGRVNLKAGLVDVIVFMNKYSGKWGANPFTLKFWDVSKPMERQTIRPSMLLYPEDCVFFFLQEE